jgi:type II secretory pathway pseudopilin PulG
MRAPRQPCATAFTVIELLTVIAIIALLVSILVPSLSAARNRAKEAKVKATLKSLNTGVEMFQTENAKEFRATNGFPPSARGEDIYEGELSYDPKETMYGAHWLIRYLFGKDLNGFVPKRAVPRSLEDRPEEWYKEKPDGLKGPLDRVGPYLDLDSVELVPTKELRGSPNDQIIDPDLAAPVAVDEWDTPILYYVARRFGEDPCGVKDEPDAAGDFGVYIQEDNLGFTGRRDAPGYNDERGWIFNRPHALANFGRPHADEIDNDDYARSFCYYVVDREVLKQTDPTGDDPGGRTLRAVRSNSFLLISAGQDMIYGTPDDVKNFEHTRD